MFQLAVKSYHGSYLADFYQRKVNIFEHTVVDLAENGHPNINSQTTTLDNNRAITKNIIFSVWATTSLVQRMNSQRSSKNFPELKVMLANCATYLCAKRRIGAI